MKKYGGGFRRGRRIDVDVVQYSVFSTVLLLIIQVAPGQLPAFLLCSYLHNSAGREEEIWGR